MRKYCKKRRKAESYRGNGISRLKELYMYIVTVNLVILVLMITFLYIDTYRRSSRMRSIKKDILENIVKFTWKQLCRNLSKTASLQERNTDAGAFLWILQASAYAHLMKGWVRRPCYWFLCFIVLIELEQELQATGSWMHFAKN